MFFSAVYSLFGFVSGGVVVRIFYENLMEIFIKCYVVGFFVLVMFIFMNFYVFECIMFVYVLGFV